jgi:deoxyadenosine/deoxycytidine kinase
MSFKRWIIDGNIGCGKSTLLESLNNLANQSWEIVPENVDEWAPYLKQFYQDMQRFSLSFQMKVLQHHMSNGKKLYPSKDTIILERSPLSCINVFGKNLVGSEFLTELDMQLMIDYNNTFGWYPDNIIYIRADPMICQKRINERNRDGESIPLNYLESIHGLYDSLYKDPNTLNDIGVKAKVYIIDGNHDKDIVLEKVLKIMNNN